MMNRAAVQAGRGFLWLAIQYAGEPMSRAFLRLLFIILRGAIRDTLLVKFLEMRDQFSDKIFKLPSRSVAELRELKTHLRHRSNDSDLSSYAEGNVVDTEDQFHSLVDGDLQWPLELHQASADAQVQNLCWTRLFSSGECLDAGKARAPKTRAAAKLRARFELFLSLGFLWRRRFALCLLLAGRRFFARLWFFDCTH